MAYDNFGEFRKGICDVLPKGQQDEAKVKVYFEWYRLARAQSEIILGRGDDIKTLAKKYGYAQTGGSVLLGAQSWDIYVNDCWIVGGIHARADFYLATVMTYDSVYNARETKNLDPTRILYVTTREISGLNLFGYTRTGELSPKGQKFTCTQPNVAANATFQAYYQHVQAVARAAR